LVYHDFYPKGKCIKRRACGHFFSGSLIFAARAGYPDDESGVQAPTVAMLTPAQADATKAHLANTFC